MAKKKKLSIDPKALALGTQKLDSSGLDMDDAEELGIDCLGAISTATLHTSFKSLCSLKINYFGPDGKPLTDWPGGEPFYRLRYLEVATDFAAQTEKKVLRYVQEPGTAPVAYFPRNQDWSLLQDPSQPLILTEGELKAAKACKEGFPTIGLGGVYNWRSHKLGLTWLPSLENIVWLRRNVYICFDSDYRTNPMVCAALRSLADELHMRGAFVHLVCLPSLEDIDKVGLDDYLVAEGTNAHDRFLTLLHEAEPLGLTKPLWHLNDKYVYVKNPGLIVDQETSFKSSPSAFKEHLECAQMYQERKLTPDGNVSYKGVPAAAAWLKWPLRKEASKLTYSPGKEKFVDDGKSVMLNIWPGWGVDAIEGDVEPFLALIKHLFTNAEPEAADWFLRWCAYPLQYPGAKMFSSAVLHGIRHGTGKSLVGYTLGRIYGQNFTEINQMDLHNSFNEWAEGKQLVMGDDVTGSNKRQDGDFLKKLITQRELRVNVKFVPSYTVPDCINYLFTANHPDSFFLEDDDRRFFIHEVQVGPLPENFYVDYDLWLDTGGSGAVFNYLLNLDLGDFNPAAPAFKTTAKERMIANVQSDLGGWVRDLLAAPDQILRIGELVLDKDLFTSKELLNLYDPIGKTGTTANGLGRELSRAGVRQVCHGKPIKLHDGSQGRYYAVRNIDRWAAALPQEVVDHICKDEMKPKKKSKY